MKKISNVINCFLLFSFPILLLTVNINTDTIDSNINAKALSTNLVSKVQEKQGMIKEDSTLERESDENHQKQSETVEQIKEDEILEKSFSVLKREETKEDKQEESITPKTDVLSTYQGTMSFYNANCVGCSGITSTGVDISDGRLYYLDKTYGNIRIVAAGTEIKKWSVIRIKNSSLGVNTLAIVLDRGGSIGLGKKFLIDMLTNSMENKGGIEKNITIEVIREGK